MFSRDEIVSNISSTLEEASNEVLAQVNNLLNDMQVEYDEDDIFIPKQ